jgi:branched-chain amino acid transport system ATP-binding protein
MSDVILRVEHLMKNFSGLRATDDLSFSVQRGQIVGLIGPNGAGKTTVFNQISGYLLPDSGKIIFDGMDITKMQPHETCKAGIGRTFQVVKPFPNKSVLYNVSVGAFMRHQKQKEVTEIAMDIISRLGLEKRKYVLAKDLNIVERKRLELAKALATQPKLLMLDEVLAGLIPSEVKAACERIRQIRDSGITILMIEHVMQAVMTLCEHVVVINYGKKIAEGTPEEVTSNPGVITAYLGEDYDSES